MQRRTLVRTRGLPAFRRALVDLAREGPSLAARRRVVVVPTRASAELLRQAIESGLGVSADASPAGTSAVVLPDLLTRGSTSIVRMRLGSCQSSSSSCQLMCI